MHICFLCDEYPPASHGGLGTLVRRLATGLVARGHRATVVGLYPPSLAGELNDGGVSVVRLPASSIPFSGLVVRTIRLRSALAKIHAAHPIDVLDGPELSLAAVSRGFPVPKVIRIVGGHHFFAVTLGRKPRPWRSWLERRSFSRADYICSGSQFAADITGELLHLRDPIEIIRFPIDTSVFLPRPDLKTERGLLVFAGTLCEKKGIRQLVQAMEKIVAAVPHAHLQVIGRDSVDPDTGQSYRATLEQSMPRAIASHVTFVGAVADTALPEIFAKAEVCLFPSHMETVGNVILEAMAVGRPVVTSRTGPCPEAIQHGVNGLLCDPYDHESIAEQTITILQDRELAQRLGAQARIDAEQRYAFSVVLAHNERFLSQCLRDWRGRESSNVELALTEPK